MRKKTQITLAVLAAALVCLAGFIFCRNLIDFRVYHRAGQSLLRGSTDLYDPNFALGGPMDYRYPPFFLVAFLPLWMIPYKIAAYLWYLFSVIEILACVVILKNAFRLSSQTDPPAEEGRHWIGWVLTLLVMGQYVIMNLHYGNAHLLAVALLFLSLLLALKRSDRLAALFISVAITIKLTPVLLLPYFAVKKRWRFLSQVGVLVMVLNLLPAVYFGWGRNLTLLKTWYQRVVVEQEFHEINGPINLSLKGQLQRLFTQVDYAQRVHGDKDYPAIHLVAWPPEIIHRLWKALALATLFGSLGLIRWSVNQSAHQQVSRRSEIESPAHGELLEISLMLCVMLLIEPLTSKIYCLALLWPVAVLSHQAFRRPQTIRVGFIRFLLILLAGINTLLPLLPGRALQRRLLVTGVDFYVTLALAVGTVLLIYSTPRALRRSLS